VKKLTARPKVAKHDPVIAIAEFYDKLEAGGGSIRIKTSAGTRIKRFRRSRRKPIFSLKE